MRRKKAARGFNPPVATVTPPAAAAWTLAAPMKKIDALAGANETRIAVLEEHNEALLDAVQLYEAGFMELEML